MIDREIYVNFYKAKESFERLKMEFNITPPKVSVMGSQKAGKSTLLEALYGIPFFPTDPSFCTKTPLLFSTEPIINGSTPCCTFKYKGAEQVMKWPKDCAWDTIGIGLAVRDNIMKIYQKMEKIMSDSITITLYPPNEHFIPLCCEDLPGIKSGDVPSTKILKERLEMLQKEPEYINLFAMHVGNSDIGSDIGLDRLITWKDELMDQDPKNGQKKIENFKEKTICVLTKVDLFLSQPNDKRSTNEIKNRMDDIQKSCLEHFSEVIWVGLEDLSEDVAIDGKSTYEANKEFFEGHSFGLDELRGKILYRMEGLMKAKQKELLLKVKDKIASLKRQLFEKFAFNEKQDKKEALATQIGVYLSTIFRIGLNHINNINGDDGSGADQINNWCNASLGDIQRLRQDPRFSTLLKNLVASWNKCINHTCLIDSKKEFTAKINDFKKCTGVQFIGGFDCCNANELKRILYSCLTIINNYILKSSASFDATESLPFTEMHTEYCLLEKHYDEVTSIDLIIKSGVYKDEEF